MRRAPAGQHVHGHLTRVLERAIDDRLSALLRIIGVPIEVLKECEVIARMPVISILIGCVPSILRGLCCLPR